MNIYLIAQTQNARYDTYDSAIVAAPSEQAAKEITPDGNPWDSPWSGWCSSAEHVTVKLLGTATEGTEAGVILGSFNAG